MLALIQAAIDAVVEGLKLANTSLSRKYLDESTKLSLEIDDLLRRPYNDQDDVLIQMDYEKYAVWLKGSKDAIALQQKS